MAEGGHGHRMEAEGTTVSYKAQINVLENRRWGLAIYERDSETGDLRHVRSRGMQYPLLWIEDIEKELNTLGYHVDKTHLSEEVFGQPILRTTAYVVDVTLL